MNNNYQFDWKQIIRRTGRNLWRQSYQDLERDFKEKVCAIARFITPKLWWGLPRRLRNEIRQVAGFLGVSERSVFLAQVAYDEFWNACRLEPAHGCTSLSTAKHFGRNLDYSYPDNAADLVYHADTVVAGKEASIEGFAGVLGWLALSNEDVKVTMNQAPCLRPLRRSAMPGLTWFRYLCHELVAAPMNPADEGDIELATAPAADLLLHIQAGKFRYLAETYDRQLVWRKVTGKVVQTNSYQLIDGLRAGDEWESNCGQRAKLALSGRSVAEGLRRASVEDWTIDTFML